MVDVSAPRTNALPEPGSFRDWDGRVFASSGRVLRALSAQGLTNWEAFADSGLYARLSESGDIVGTSVADDAELDELRQADPGSSWVAALVHERVPFVSYPYEWTFSMLQDAALLQLRLTAAALEEGLVLKDATPYNIQWRGARPVFVDVGSFEPRRAGEPWAGYRQFCMLYLYPLLLEAYRGVPFQPLLRGRLDGIPPTDFRALFTRRDALRRGMLKHVFLHASLERRNAGQGADVRSDLAAAGFDADLIRANVDKLAVLVRRLNSAAPRTEWENYRATCSYEAHENAQKEDFVRRVASGRRRSLTWDLGCNDGRYSRIAASNSGLTIALDSDATTVDALYRVLREDDDQTILPLVVDLADPSPGLGWRNQERRTLPDRASPDLTLCLALVHHLSITNNIPLREIVRWLRSLGSEIVVEFPDRTDPMVGKLLGSKRQDAHPDYSREMFERLLVESFDIVESLPLSTRTRTIYHARPR